MHCDSVPSDTVVRKETLNQISITSIVTASPMQKQIQIIRMTQLVKHCDSVPNAVSQVGHWNIR